MILIKTVDFFENRCRIFGLAKSAQGLIFTRARLNLEPVFLLKQKYKIRQSKSGTCSTTSPARDVYRWLTSVLPGRCFSDIRRYRLDLDAAHNVAQQAC